MEKNLVKVVCDRCGKEMDLTFEEYRDKILYDKFVDLPDQYDENLGVIDLKDYNLCHECVGELVKFLHNK